jgi:predicted regulator of Ras-like GTPase activity (Roadblock/LC7/MglB family)
MSASRVEKIQKILNNLSNTPDITGSALVNADGFVIASLLHQTVDEDLVAGMATTIFSVGERISNKLMNSELEQTYVRTGNGYIIIQSISRDMMLVCLTSKEAKLGLLFLEIKSHVPQLAQLV